jgi:hypothetical protein
LKEVTTGLEAAVFHSQHLLIGVVGVAVLGAPSALAEILIATAGPMTGVYAWAGERYQRGASWRSRISTPKAVSSVNGSSSPWATTSAMPIRRWR